MKRQTVAVAVLLIGALALASCGRRGSLERPPATPKQAAAEAKHNASQALPSIQVNPSNKPIVFDGSGDKINDVLNKSVDDNSFILDSLLN